MARYRSVSLFCLLAILWGGSFVAIKAGLNYFPPILYAAIRYDTATIFLFGYAISTTEYWWPRTRADWLAVALYGMLVIGAYNAFLFTGQQGVTSTVAAILIAMNPIIATGISRIVLPSERLTRLGIVGLLLGFLGVGIVAQPDPSNLLTRNLLAQVLVLAAAASVALGSVLVQRVDDEIPAVSVTAWACGIGAVMLHVTSLGFTDESLTEVQWTIEALFAVGYLGVLASALGYFIYFDLLAEVGPIETNLISYAEPIPAGVFGWILLGETVDSATAIGFCVIFIGFVLLKRRAFQKELKILERANV